MFPQRRMTTDTPDGNYSQALNLFVRGEDGWVQMPSRSISLNDYMKQLIKAHNADIDTEGTPEEFDMTLCEHLFDGLIEHRLADTRGERVDGHDAAGDLVRALALKEGIGHLRAARRTLGTAEEDVGVAGVEGVFEVGLVEIGKFKRAGLVDGAELDKVEPLANAREPGLTRDDGADTGILAGD